MMTRGCPTRLEHVPVASYHLLRRLDEGAVSLASLHGNEDEYAVQFLTSRKLARTAGPLLIITPIGRAIGEVADERASVGPTVRSLSRRTLAAASRQVEVSSAGRPFSEVLLDAAQNIDDLSRAHILILVRQAARALRLAEDEPRELTDAANDDSHRPQRDQ